MAHAGEPAALAAQQIRDAAPDLLEALKEAAGCLDHSNPTKGTYTYRTLKLARKAIKKAEGN